MEKHGQAIKAIGRIIGFMLKAALYILWGASRVAEVTLAEFNGLLRRVLEKKKA